MRDFDTETTEIEVEICHETDRALLVSDGDVTSWVPKSQISYDEGEVDNSETVTVTLPEWLAKDKGFI